MNDQLVKINGTIVKKSICDTLGIPKRSIKVKSSPSLVTTDGEYKRWDVFIDEFEMPSWWSIYIKNTDLVSYEHVKDVTENFCKKIKKDKVRKISNGKVDILDVSQLISKLNLEYKLDLLN